MQIKSIANTYNSDAPSPDEVRAVKQRFHRDLAAAIRREQQGTAKRQRTLVPEEGNVGEAVEKLERRIREATLGIELPEPVRERPKSYPRDLQTILQELQKQHEELRELEKIDCKARGEAAELEKVIEYCNREIPKRTEKIIELMEEFQALNSKLENDPNVRENSVQ